MQIEKIQTKIYEIRGQKVMLDFDLAELYEVETRILNQAVKRNIDIFPEDFMFQLIQAEWESNSSQFVMSSRKHRGAIYLPFAFTEHGVTMLANVLKSKKARQTSIAIVRAFITLKQFVLTYKELSEKLQELENKYDKQFKSVYDAINFLLQKDNQETEQKQRKRIGFKSDETN
jgi:phage regulator Rha-like protein